MPESSAKTPTTATEPRFAKKGSQAPATEESEKIFAKQKGLSRKIPDKIYESDEAMEIWAELRNAEPGFRKRGAAIDGAGNSYETISQKSTFPKWVPSELREKKLFEKVLDHIGNKTVPTNKRELELYDIVHNEMRQRLDMPLIDFEKEITPPGFKPPTANTQPVKKGGGDIKESRVYQRTREMLGEGNKEKVTYTEAHLDQQAEKATKMLQDDPEKATRIARGIEKAPDDQLQESISIAVAQDALEKGDLTTYKELVKSRSLRQTRRGQEIVAERGRVDVNSPDHFIKEVLNERMRRANTAAEDQMAGLKTTSKGKKVVSKIDKEVKTITEEISKSKLKVDEARKFIDDLICK